MIKNFICSVFELILSILFIIAVFLLVLTGVVFSLIYAGIALPCFVLILLILVIFGSLSTE